MSLLQIPSRKCLVAKQCLHLLQHTQEGARERGMSEAHWVQWLLPMPAYMCTYLDVNYAIQELPNQRYKSSKQHKGKHTAMIECDTKEVEIFAAFLKCRNRFTKSHHLRNTDTGQINGERRAYLF